MSGPLFPSAQSGAKVMLAPSFSVLVLAACPVLLLFGVLAFRTTIVTKAIIKKEIPVPRKIPVLLFSVNLTFPEMLERPNKKLTEIR